MNPRDLHLWEEAALPPSQGRPTPRPTRRRSEPDAAARAREMERARRLRARARAATLHGLFLSLFFSAPLGWTVLQSTVWAPDPSAQEACPDLASFLPTALQRQLHGQKTRGGLSASERRTLGTKVCDPALRAVLSPILGGVSSLGELREMAKESPMARGAEPEPVVRNLLAGMIGD